MPKALLCLNYLHRLQDNPLFIYCAKHNLEIIPFVLFTESHLRELGAAEKLWLNQSLLDFDKSLAGKLLILKTQAELNELIKAQKPKKFLYSFNADTRTALNYKKLEAKYQYLEFIQFQANNIFDFDQIRNKAGGIFKVFTSFYKNCLNEKQKFIHDQIQYQLSSNIEKHIKFIKLKPAKIITEPIQAWHEKLLVFWNISEKAARKTLTKFAKKQVQDYPEARDLPARAGTSKLSPYLHFGMISPFRIWFEIEDSKAKAADANPHNAFLRQLCWREFAQYILFYFPHSSHANLYEKFDKFPWQKNPKALKAWQQGLTGYPIVDAGMRELWATGWLHNRVRMIVGSFLVKDLMIDWRQGASWFEDTLFDADLPNNSMAWQWLAGSGVDASPYFRIFNPITQSEKFDKEAKYLRQWLPELSKLDNKWIHKPFEAPELILEAAGIKLGKDYPYPIVNHAAAREAALAAYKSLS